MTQPLVDRNPPVIQLTLRQRPLVLLGSLVAAGLIACALAWADQWQRDFYEIAGTFMTAWALVLAILIYILSSVDVSAVINDADDAREALADAYEDAGGQVMSDPVLRKKLVEFGEYVIRLQEKYRVPADDIVHIDRAPQKNQERNRAVLIHTRHGKRYSVFHGGKGGGWHVTKY
ncbi:hypothetical protein [Arthrobacter sp. zg-Y1143]|uniref:hypothetical protein n=1 Tax=Arthrobacter sp. zg-Y1143 TaxID=3049065 RepID=UPI0024C44038|nr:hypothetical protein [Arthrobacter sp. zg-Y1143]MDK1327564.1 hypothetical protein [Arthrobacter sp. zg-Y1143]